MSTRLQIVVSEEELVEIREIAERRRMTVSEWVRQTLREARQRVPRRTTEQKLEALRRAAEYDAPAGDVDQMNADIARGYLAAEPRR